MTTPPLTSPELVAKEIFHEALLACRVDEALKAKLVSASGPARPASLVYGALPLNLSGVTRLLVIAMGKAAGSMATELLRQPAVVAGREITGVLVAPAPVPGLPSGITYFAGGHPFPNQDSFAAARVILQLLREEPASPHTFCFFLISGGASAMVELPLDERIYLEDAVAFHRALVHSGAAIQEMNCVRKHFSAVKGGRLGLAAAHLRNVTLLVSDVPPQHLDALASSPSLPDSSTVQECKDVLARYSSLRRFPEAVRAFFSRDLPETPKPGEFHAPSLLLLSPEDLATAASAAAAARGYFAVVDNTCDDWDYRAAAGYLLERFRNLRREHGRVCLISVGELSVTIGQPGSANAAELPQGGRNQHFLLHCSTQLTPQHAGMAVLSCGSDGIDGNSPAAGAVFSPEAWQQFPSLPYLDAQRALEQFASYTFLNAIGRTVITGPTGANLRDLRILLAP